MTATTSEPVQTSNRLASLKPRGFKKEANRGFNARSCGIIPDQRDNLQRASHRFVLSRAEARELLLDLIDLFGRAETSAILVAPVWLIEQWLDNSGHLFAWQKRMIWLVWCLFFAPHKLRSPFDIITSGRFVPDPATGELLALKAEWKRKAKRKRKPGRKPRKRN